MAGDGWTIEGQYFETCNCEYLCPCISSNMAAKPDEGDCAVALAFRIDRGSKGGVALDGLAFIVVARTKGAMIDGGWTVGLIVDERASEEQADAILAIASGQAGGPMAGLSSLIGSFAGVDRRPIGLDNTLHPANPRLALAKATRSRFDAFGITWNDASGSRNGHFAPFHWAA